MCTEHVGVTKEIGRSRRDLWDQSEGDHRTTLFIGGIVAIFCGVNAEGKALEDVATPLGVVGKPAAAIFRSGADREGIDS